MAQLGVYLAVHLCASASCLVDGHNGSSCCMCVRSTGITEVLELTSQECRQRMHKWDFVLKALEFALCPWWKQGRGQCTLQSLSELWAIRNEMITSDNLANDLHWGRGHIKLNELHQCTWFPGLSSHFSFSFIHLNQSSFLLNLRCFLSRRIGNFLLYGLSIHKPPSSATSSFKPKCAISPFFS